MSDGETFGFDADGRDALVATLIEMADAVSARERSVRERTLETLRMMAVAQVAAWTRLQSSSAALDLQCERDYRTAAFLASVLDQVCAGFDVTSKLN